MAVSGADWRKSADGYRTDAASRARFVRPDTGGLSAASGLRTGGFRGCVARTLADDTDRSENSVTFDSVGTDEPDVSGPLAIGVATETGSATESSDDGHADSVAVDSSGTGDPTGGDPGGYELYLRSFHTRLGYPTGCVGRRPIHGETPSANESRRQIMDHTVIIK